MERRRRWMGERGFTYVEVLVVVMISVLVVNGMVWALTRSGQMVWTRTDSKMVSLAAVQRALDRVSEDLRRASRATVLCAAGQLTFGQDTNGDQIIDRTIIYSRNAAAGTLIRTENNGAPKSMAAQITAFTPSCQASGLVRLQVTAQVAMPASGSVTQRLSSQVRVPNP